MSVRYRIHGIEEPLLGRGNGRPKLFAVEATDPCAPSTGRRLVRLNSISSVLFHGKAFCCASSSPVFERVVTALSKT
jgi:hypothetical protein